ncbi:hypothetical protein MMPV_000928 [Pyropia vietnamensis]
MVRDFEYGGSGGTRMADDPPKNISVVLHGIFSILLLTLSLTLIATSVYNIVKVNSAALPLVYSGPSFFHSATRLGILGVCLGVALALFYVALGMVLTGGRRRISIVLAIVVVTAQFIAFVLMLFLAVSTLLVAAVPLRSAVDAYWADSWSQTVATAPDDVCGLERSLGCRGYRNDQCEACTPAEAAAGGCTVALRRVCAPCVGGSTAGGRGCVREIEVLTRRWFEPLGIVASVLAGLLLIHMLLICLV